jgi:hypothetical protein
VCNLAEFKKRLNIFSSGYSHVDVFEGIDWNIFGITGSVMPACVLK